MDSYSGSLSSSNKKDYFLSEHFDLCSSAILMQLPKANVAAGPPHPQSDPRPPVEEGDASRRAHEGPPGSTFMGRCTLPSLQVVFCLWSHVSDLLGAGTFGKAPWRPPHDLTAFGPPLAHNGITLHENPYAAADANTDPEEEGDDEDGVYERPFDGGRTEPPPPRRTST